MKRPTLYCAITGHGFGHAVRTACIASQVQKICPEVLVIMATRSPRWLLECYLEKPFIHRPVAFDVGVIQADSLRMDEGATLEALTKIYGQENKLVAMESNYLRNNRVDLVLADIPALAVAIAHRADIPCWMSSNFGWNFIYGNWGDKFGQIVEKIERDYGQCDLLFHLPLSEPMEIFPCKISAGLLGGDPKYSEQTLREVFGIKTAKEKTILLTFGGLGLQSIPYQVLSQFPDYQFITFDVQAPKLDNLTIITDKIYRPVDLMPVCGRVFSKPGFGTFAEALKLEVPIISLTRNGFAEAEVLLEGLQNYGEHQIVPHQQFFDGNWDFLLASPHKSRLGQKLDKHGDRLIAEKIVAHIS